MLHSKKNRDKYATWLSLVLLNWKVSFEKLLGRGQQEDNELIKERVEGHCSDWRCLEEAQQEATVTPETPATFTNPAN